jgi:molybdopterin synthase sulfur carrier subunit
MKVLFFAQARQLANAEQHLLQTDHPLTQPEFWSRLIQAFPKIASLQKSARLARNETYLQSDELLNPDDEIAIIPPVSGG